jgi:dephospho-CoA kinase
VDVVWTVKAAEKTRIKRLFKKGFKLSEIRKRFKAQGRVNAFYAKATLVLPNDASFLTLQKKFNTAFLELTH